MRVTFKQIFDIKVIYQFNTIKQFSGSFNRQAFFFLLCMSKFVGVKVGMSLFGNIHLSKLSKASVLFSILLCKNGILFT